MAGDGRRIYAACGFTVGVSLALSMNALLSLGWRQHERAKERLPGLRNPSPLVVTFPMHAERSRPRTTWNTVDALLRLDYDFLVVDAVNGPALGRARVEGLPELRGVSFDNVDVASFVRTNRSFTQRSYLAQLGAFASHARAWTMVPAVGRPVISLEFDVQPTRAWPAGASGLVSTCDYDVLILHEHNRQPSRCDPSRKDLHVMEGRDTWYAAGAVLITNVRPGAVMQRLRETSPIAKPVDHWLLAQWATGTLRMGTLCPPLFESSDRHKSTLV